MPGIVLAWLAGEGIVIYRAWHNQHRPPMPGQLLGTTGVFAALGLIARNDDAKFLAGALAWGFVIAAFMNVAPSMLTGATSAVAAENTANTTKTATPKGAKA